MTFIRSPDRQLCCIASLILVVLRPAVTWAAEPANAAAPGVAILLVDTDCPAGQIDERIYGQFLEHINHSVVDGLYAEQIRGQGFEANDFKNYWQTIEDGGSADLVPIRFEQGEKCVRLEPKNGTTGVRQNRIYLQTGMSYDGSLWINPEQRSPKLALQTKDSSGRVLANLDLPTKSTGWQEVQFKFDSSVTDPQCSLEILATGSGSALVDFISLMPADARAHGKLRPDLRDAIGNLHPAFIRWPGGSFASIYKWKDGIGPAVKRKMNPNTLWGGYSDYYGFGTDEFLEFCRQINTEPLIVLSATNTSPAQFEYAMDWVHYLLDPPNTDWGKMRAANGHTEPYRIPYFQIDNEPMNHGHTPESYAAIVNLYGPRLRELAADSKIIACGQKRSNDMDWSQKLVDIAGDNFDILGCHNYEYEPGSFATGVRRIEDYQEKLCDYIRASKHPKIKLAILEWSLARTYDWRSGLHAAGSLMSYERLSPTVIMTCPALLMRSTTDNPEWRAWIYHDHVSWFAGSGYVAEKLFRDHFAPVRYAFTSGTFRDIAKRSEFFDGISQMKPEGWTPNTVDAIATGSPDGHRIVLKAVNYAATSNTLLTRLQGKAVPADATVQVATITAPFSAENALADPNSIQPIEASHPFARDMAFPLPPYSVIAVEIEAK
jgi:alpha-L-arabinofuranosidase